MQKLLTFTILLHVTYCTISMDSNAKDASITQDMPSQAIPDNPIWYHPGCPSPYTGPTNAPLFYFPPYAFPNNAQRTQPFVINLNTVNTLDSIHSTHQKHANSANTTNNVDANAEANPTMNVEVDTAVETHATADAQADADAEANAYVDNTITNNISQPWWTGPTDAIGSLIANNKHFLLLTGAVGTYAYIYHQLQAGNKYLHNRKLWSSWKRDYKLKELLEMPHDTLSAQLLHTICYRYVSAIKPFNQHYALQKFMRSLERERSRLRYYKKLYRQLNRAHLIRLFPRIHHKRYRQITYRLRRLAFVEHVFRKWVAKQLTQQKPELTSAAPAPAPATAA